MRIAPPYSTNSQVDSRRFTSHGQVSSALDKEPVPMLSNGALTVWDDAFAGKGEPIASVMPVSSQRSTLSDPLITKGVSFTRLKLRTVLSLIPDAPGGVFQAFSPQYGIRSIHLPVDKVKYNVPLTYNRAVEALQIIIDQENLPFDVHCLDGASVTGLVICCLRKLQTWNVSSALGEFLRYLRGGVINSDELAFVEKFCSEIEISQPIPHWLWEGQVSFKKHPTLKLHFTPPSASATTPAGSSNTLSATAPSPVWSLQGTMNDAHLLDGTINSGSTTGAGDLYFGTVGPSAVGVCGDGNSIVGHGATGSGHMVGLVESMAPASLLSPRTGQLSNHVSRFSAKGGSRDRAHVSKRTIRTDIGGHPGQLAFQLRPLQRLRRLRTSREQVSTETEDLLEKIIVGGQKAEKNSTDGSVMSRQDRASGIQTGIKNAPVPHEAVNEHYEISMTLKALSLVGADFLLGREDVEVIDWSSFKGEPSSDDDRGPD
ncbi:MAG: tyrosine phosphatase family-domain-containing protein [Benniella sp.]|nr:MAG: tyrosine phosphatase family-domain-containing protein [Benniella sp.]